MSALLLMAISFLVAAALIFLMRPLALRAGYVDTPKLHKQHDTPTPLCGSAIVLAFVSCGYFLSDSPAYHGVSLGLLLMMALGAIDDWRHIAASLRLVVQALAVLLGMAALGGLKLHNLGALWGDQSVVLELMALPFLIFATVGVINTINMIDGMDGLAASFTLLVLVVFACYAASITEQRLLCISIGAVAGFLVFNMRTPWRHQAGIFLGDAGSLALGFLLTYFAVSLSQSETTTLRPISMVWIFGLPLVDSGYLMISRALRGESPMQADRHHFHHLLLGLGLPVGAVLILWLSVASGFVGVALLGEAMNIAESVMCASFLALFGVYYLAMTLAWRLMRAPDFSAGT